jgi:hypothetical protein
MVRRLGQQSGEGILGSLGLLDAADARRSAGQRIAAKFNQRSGLENDIG